MSYSTKAAAAAKLLQSYPTLCDPIDSSPPSSTIPGILQARTLEWVAISFSNAWKWKMKVKLLSCVWLLVTPWIAAYQVPWDFLGKSTGVGCRCLLRHKGYYNNIPQSRWLKNSTNVSVTFLGSGNQISGWGHGEVLCLVRPTSCFLDIFLSCSHMEEGVRSFLTQFL